MKEFQNPSQEPGAEKNLLIVLGAMLLFMFLFQQYASKNAPKQPPQPAAQQTSQPAAAPASAPSTGAVAPGAHPSAVAHGAAPTAASAPVKQAAAETETVIENDLYRVTFTNRGAQVKSWLLKKQKDDKGNDLDLVNARAAQQYGYPLSLFTYDDALRTKLNSAMYVPSATGELTVSKTAPATVTFEFSDGVTTARKTFQFDDSYVVHVSTQVRQNGAVVSAYPAWPSGFGDQLTLPSYAVAKIELQSGSDVHRYLVLNRHFYKSNEWVPNGATLGGPFEWGGVSDQYFAAIFLPDSPSSTSLVEFNQPIPQDPAQTDPQERDKKHFDVLGAAVGDPAGDTSERVFVGPKALEVLQAIHAYAPGSSAAALSSTTSANSTPARPNGTNLEKVVDFGFFGIIAKPLFLWLKWTHEHLVSNWGWAICFLTFIITLVLFPLRYTGMKSQMKMAKVAPEVKRINDRYRGISLTDPRQQEKQREIQELYHREGINQFGGCLPMILQLPLLYAFYAMLASTTELRHAHWLWVHDLSSPDPTRLLPIFIVGSMWLMQRITPMAGVDPAQAKMMQVMMPMMFGLFMWNLPAGLSVYFATSNILGWVQQRAMNKNMKAATPKVIEGKRSRKR